MRNLAVAITLMLTNCTYDSTPPTDEKINDSKPIVVIDATGFSPERSVQIQYSDLNGSVTLSTTSEKTDSSGRFLYPLSMTRGTRSFTLTLVIDETGDGLFASGDRKYSAAHAFTSDSETKNLALKNSADFSAN